MIFAARFVSVISLLICFGQLSGALAEDAAEVAAKLQQTFQTLDSDGTGELTLAEFLAAIPEKQQKTARRDFRIADADQNEKLSFAEFPSTQGVAVPDPWAERSASALATWRGLLADADQNKDEKLSPAEWPAAALKEKLRPFDDIAFADWDADRDGQVDLTEAQRLIDIAYGLRHPDGSRLRFPDGSVVFWSYLREMDRDADGAVAEEEFVAAHWMGAEKNTKYFREIDADHDGRLSPAEFAAETELRAHVLNAFREIDADFDGLLSGDELSKQSPLLQEAPRALSLGFKPFDEDGDGRMSLREYCLVPIGGLNVTVDLLRRTDADRDGSIAWSEFPLDALPLFRGVAWEVFRRYDRNHDERLTIEEYDFPVDGTPAALAELFRVQDENGNGTLSLPEFLSVVPADQRKRAERDFRVMDFDRNAELSLNEYQATKGGAVPDPWQTLAHASFQKIQAIFKSADLDGDGRVSRQEWPSVRDWGTSYRPFGELIFAQWDFNQDGTVTDAEASRLVDLAYGLCLPTGEPARWPDGSVLYWSHLVEIDRNGDFTLTRDDFAEAERLGKDVRKNPHGVLFPKLDANSDDKLTYADLAAPGSAFRVNAVQTFFAYDRNLDGRLSHDELLRGSPSAIHKKLRLQQGLAAYDLDHDGFDLDEFRMSPVGLLYVTASLLDQKDLDQDSVITWMEFQPVRNLLFAGILWETFRRYDRDGDGELTADEYDIPEDPQLQQFVHQVSLRTRETLKAELRFFLTVCQLDDAQRQAMKPAVATMLNIVARRMATRQKRFTGVNPQLPAPEVDPLSIFANRFGQFAEMNLPEDVAQTYRREMESRIARRRESTVMVLVSRLDRDLLLSEDQRRDISAALSENWQPAWMNQVEHLMQSDQMMVTLPEDCLAPHLSKSQLNVWQTMSKATLEADGVVLMQGGIEGNAEPDDLDDLLPPAPNPNRGRVRPARVRALDVKKAIDFEETRKKLERKQNQGE